MYGVLFDKSGEKKIVIKKGQEIHIGREAVKDESLVVDDGYVSRSHASITFDKEFYLRDLNSRNGSYINGKMLGKGEILALTDGDTVRFGNCEYLFRIAGIEKEYSVYGGYSCSVKNSAGGRRLRVEAKKRGCIDYQLRMIEENPELKIAEIIYVKNIENDCFLCDIGDCLNLSDYIKQYRKTVDAEELVENILRIVKEGEEHMLERKKYLIHPETVFMDKDGNIKLIYIPSAEEKTDTFSFEMRDLCRYLSKQHTGEERERIVKLADSFERAAVTTTEHIKNLYKHRNSKADLLNTSIYKADANEILKKEYAVSLISFLILMAVCWTGVAGMTGTVILFVIFIALNASIYFIKVDVIKSAVLKIKETDRRRIV